MSTSPEMYDPLRSDITEKSHVFDVARVIGQMLELQGRLADPNINLAISVGYDLSSFIPPEVTIAIGIVTNTVNDDYSEINFTCSV